MCTDGRALLEEIENKKLKIKDWRWLVKYNYIDSPYNL